LVVHTVNDASDLYAESILREFRLPPRSDTCALLRYYAARSGDSFTDVSGQPIGPIFRVQESMDYHYSLCNNPEESTSQKVSIRILPETTTIFKLLQFFSVNTDGDESSALQ
jgi:hypothetical protein